MSEPSAEALAIKLLDSQRDPNGDWHEMVDGYRKIIDAELEPLRRAAEQLQRMAEMRSVLDRLYSAAAEQQHTLQSKGWRVDQSQPHLKHSIASAFYRQYREVDDALTDVRDFLDGRERITAIDKEPPCQPK